MTKPAAWYGDLDALEARVAEDLKAYEEEGRAEHHALLMDELRQAECDGD